MNHEPQWLMQTVMDELRREADRARVSRVARESRGPGWWRRLGRRVGLVRIAGRGSAPAARLVASSRGASVVVRSAGCGDV